MRNPRPDKHPCPATGLIVFCFAASLTGPSSAAEIARADDARTGPRIEKRIVSRWPNGQPLHEETYRIDAKGEAVKHGPDIEYFENGKKRLEVEYVNGKLNGSLTEWEPLEGSVVRQGGFANGRETGKWTWWALGEKTAECTYKDGRIVGKKRYWFEGKLSAEETYDQAGERVQYTAWHRGKSASQMERQGTFKHGQKDGKWIYWNADGTIKAEGEWKDGKPWSGTCGVPVAGDAGSWAGLETFALYKDGKKIEPK